MKRRDFIKAGLAGAAAAVGAGCAERNTDHYRVGFDYAHAHAEEIRRFLWEAILYVAGMGTGKSGPNGSLTSEAAELLELARGFEKQYAPGFDPLDSEKYSGILSMLERGVRGIDQTRIALQTHSPNNYHKLMGLIDGCLGMAGRVYEPLFMAVQFAEMEGTMLTGGKAEACTAVAFRPELTELGEPILAKNFDFITASGFGNVMRTTRLSNGMSSLAMTMNTFPGAISAVNTNLAITENYWGVNTTDDNGKFLPASCTVQDLIEDPGATTMAKGIEFLNGYENGGYFFLLGVDRDGQIALIENSPRGKVSLMPKTDYFVATNHVQLNHDPMPPLGNPSESSYDRHERVHTLVDAIKEQHRKVTLSDIIAMLSDHQGGEGHSICRHERPGTDDSTVGSIIMLPRSGTAYAALGTPCDTLFELHQL